MCVEVPPLSLGRIWAENYGSIRPQAVEGSMQFTHHLLPFFSATKIPPPPYIPFKRYI